MTDEPSTIPSILRPLSTDEYEAPERTEVQREAATRVATMAEESARRVGQPLRAYVPSQRGTAAGLLALNEATGTQYFEVPPEAGLDTYAAAEAFASDGPVIDVQTHWIADRPTLKDFQSNVLRFYSAMAPDWWKGLDGVVAYDIAQYLRCVFVEAETALAVISCAPGNASGEMFLRNDEMAGMRELFDRTAGNGRLLNHTVVRPNIGETECMAEWAATYRPVGWKVYTLGLMDDTVQHFRSDTGWRLDDEVGMRFLEEARAVGVPLVCAHKGVSGMVDAGSPSDIGPAAKAFPNIDFVVYHSGYEPGNDEGPYTPETADLGINRLIQTVIDNDLGPGSNVYAELGTTWFMLLSRPEDAAHVLGKLLLNLGEDNIIWGTDSIWYGPTQPVLDAFRTFQIPDAMCEQFGYPKISAAAKRKILAAGPRTRPASTALTSTRSPTRLRTTTSAGLGRSPPSGASADPDGALSHDVWVDWCHAAAARSQRDLRVGDVHHPRGEPPLVLIAAADVEELDVVQAALAYPHHSGAGRGDPARLLLRGGDDLIARDNRDDRSERAHLVARQALTGADEAGHVARASGHADAQLR